MNMPEIPPAFRAPTPAERPWWWRLEDASGAEVEVPEEYADQRFPSQADAESWIGEIYSELTQHGVDQVVLFELESKVYGPMSLHP